MSQIHPTSTPMPTGDAVRPPTGRSGGTYRPSELNRRSGLPTLDREARIRADIVFMNSTGAMGFRVRDALLAYVYSIECRATCGHYPSDAEVAAVIALAREERTR